MDYIKKLVKFNSTKKYEREMRFMKKLVNPRKHELILDYGCGLGTLVNYLNKKTEAIVHGYDKKNYTKNKRNWFRTSLGTGYDKICLMHSLGHFEDSIGELLKIKECLANHGKVYVITPNKNYCDRIDNKNYILDPTLVQHFTPKSLEVLFTELDFEILMQGSFGETIEGHHERLFLEAKK